MNLIPRMNFLSRSLVPAFVLASAAALHAAPGNDSPAGSTELLAGPIVTSSNVGATVGDGEIIPAGYTSETYTGSVWWHWKPIFSGWYQISTAGSSINTVLSVWTSATEGGPLSLVHVNGDTIQFYADNSTSYKIAVAGSGASEQGALSLQAVYIPNPFAKVVSATFDQSAVDVTSGTASGKATLTIEASRELAEGTFNIVDLGGLEIVSVPFSSANRISGTVAQGEYEVSFTLPQYIAAGSYSWNVSVANSAVNKLASQGAGAMSPLSEESASTLTVINNGTVDGYAQWVAANGGGSLSSLLGGSSSLDGALSLDTYAFGLNGDALVVEDGSVVSTGEPNITVAGGDGDKRLRVEFAKRKDAAKNGLGYQVQFSDNLIDWEDATTPEQTFASNGAFDAVVVEDTVTTADVPRRFARVLVERIIP